MDSIYFANLLLGQIQKQQSREYQDLLNQTHKLQCRFEEFITQNRLMEKAIARQWMAAAYRCRNCMDVAAHDIPWMLSNVRQSLDRREQKLPTMKDILAEFDQIAEELGEISFDRKDHCLSIQTDPITLEDVFLGDFKIGLYVDQLFELARRRPYEIIALNPHPAQSSSEVTHPHVTGRVLCEGDGAAAIRNALVQGRLFDFFNMVVRILNTYNPGSAYILLADWEGGTCSDCGGQVYEVDRYVCNQCDQDFCENCTTVCSICEGTFCYACIGKCDCCEAALCRYCVKKCKQCGALCCVHCIENDLCTSCQQENDHENQSNPDPNPSESIPTSQPAVFPDGLGQAAVLPGPGQP